MEPKFCPFMSTQEKKVLCVPSCALCLQSDEKLYCSFTFAAINCANPQKAEN